MGVDEEAGNEYDSDQDGDRDGRTNVSKLFLVGLDSSFHSPSLLFGLHVGAALN